jgi:hypothetical protein
MKMNELIHHPDSVKQRHDHCRGGDIIAILIIAITPGPSF